MDSRSFLGLEPTHNPFRWKLPVTIGISAGGQFLFGGSGLAAAIAAMESTSGRQCVWATGQYLSYAKPGEVVDIGILTGNAALGDRPMDLGGQWETMPEDLPAPLDCPVRPDMHDSTDSI